MILDLDDLEEGELRDYHPQPTQASQTSSIFDGLDASDEDIDWGPLNTVSDIPLSVPPAVISLNDPVGYIPPRPPPLVPRDAFSDPQAIPRLQPTTPVVSSPNTDESDSDLATSKLFASMKLKQKTPTPENSSEETDIRPWFSPASTSSITSVSSRKRPRSSVTNIADQVTSSTNSMFAAIQTMQEQKNSERHKDREDRKSQRNHKLVLQERQMAHERLKMDHDLRKMELEVELQYLKVQECAMEHGMHSSEGNDA